MSSTWAAPGKLFATGAWAILEGAPAIVMAVDRYAIADVRGPASERPEVVAVARRVGKRAPAIDVRALEEGGRKLGLGSSAAAVVAAAAALLETNERRRVFDLAFAAHADVQPRGSGGDVAAATWGGVVRVQRRGGELDVAPVAWPHDLVVRALALPRSARTSDALDRLADRKAAARGAMNTLIAAAEQGADAISSNDATKYRAAASAHVEGLSMLGRTLDLPLLPPELDRAREVLGPELVNASHGDAPQIVLLPSGAGGGDTVLWLGARAPTDHEAAALAGAGLHLLDLALDPHGVHERKH